MEGKSDTQYTSEEYTNSTDGRPPIARMVYSSADGGLQRPVVPVLQQLIILAAILLLVFAAGYLPNALRSINRPPAPQETDKIPLRTVSEEPPSSPFSNVQLYATSAYVFDVAAQRTLYERQPDKQLPLASLAKLMTALVAYELLYTTEEVTIPESAIRQDGDSGLRSGETFSLKNLLDLTLISSSNDGAFAMAHAAGALLSQDNPEAAFVRAMNIRARELGLTQTFFRNPTGLDLTERESGAYGSARDVALLMQYILTRYPNILERTLLAKTRITNKAGTYHEVENTNRIIDDIEGLIGSKTGYTDLAGGNLAIAFNAALNRPVIIVVLGSTFSGRFDDVRTLATAARTAVASQAVRDR